MFTAAHRPVAVTIVLVVFKEWGCAMVASENANDSGVLADKQESHQPALTVVQGVALIFGTNIGAGIVTVDFWLC